MAQPKTGMILIVAAIVLFLGGGTLVGMGVERFLAAGESEKLAAHHLEKSRAAAAAGNIEEATTSGEWAVGSAVDSDRQRSEGTMWTALGGLLVAGSVVLLVLGRRRRRPGGAPAAG